MIDNGKLTTETSDVREPAPPDPDELRETLAALLLERRLLDFADALDEEDRLILHRRLLASEPVSIGALANVLGVTDQRAASRVRALEERMRHALRDPGSHGRRSRRADAPGGMSGGFALPIGRDE